MGESYRQTGPAVNFPSLGTTLWVAYEEHGRLGQIVVCGDCRIGFAFVEAPANLGVSGREPLCHRINTCGPGVLADGVDPLHADGELSGDVTDGRAS